MNFTKVVNSLLLEFLPSAPLAKFINPTEQFTTTHRDSLYRRYGKELADRLIAQANKRQQERPLKDFVAPKYTDKNLDAKLTYNLINNKNNTGANGAVFAGSKNIDIFNNDGKNVGFNKVRDELKYNKFTPHTEDGVMKDLVKHEGDHTLQTVNNRFLDLLRTYASKSTFPWKKLLGVPQGIQGSDYKQRGKWNDGKIKERMRKFGYSQNAVEPAAWLSELKTWYFYETGKALDAYASNEDIEEFKKAAIEYINSTKSPKAHQFYLDVLELLDLEEGKELFRQIVQSNSNNFKNYV